MPIVTNDLVHAAIANRAELKSLQEGLARLEQYLASEKFRAWDNETGERLNPSVGEVEATHVSARDVLARIATIRTEAWAAAVEAV